MLRLGGNVSKLAIYNVLILIFLLLIQIQLGTFANQRSTRLYKYYSYKLRYLRFKYNSYEQTIQNSLYTYKLKSILFVSHKKINQIEKNKKKCNWIFFVLYFIREYKYSPNSLNNNTVQSFPFLSCKCLPKSVRQNKKVLGFLAHSGNFRIQ